MAIILISEEEANVRTSYRDVFRCNNLIFSLVTSQNLWGAFSKKRGQKLFLKEIRGRRDFFEKKSGMKTFFE